MKFWIATDKDGPTFGYTGKPCQRDGRYFLSESGQVVAWSGMLDLDQRPPTGECWEFNLVRADAPAAETTRDRDEDRLFQLYACFRQVGSSRENSFSFARHDLQFFKEQVAAKGGA